MPRPLLALAAAGLLAVALPPAASEISVDPSADFVPNEVVAVFHERIPSDIDAFVAPYGEVKARGVHLPWVAVSTQTEDAAIAALEARSDVRDAHRALYVYGQQSPAVDDPLFPDQWWLPAVGAPTAWTTTTGSSEVKVAVVDSGVDGDHPDLDGNLCGPHWSPYPWNGPLVDEVGHGTAVAGIVAAETDNGIGVAGMAQVCLMIAKEWNPGICANCYDVPILGASYHSAEAIAWAANSGARIISMSFATPNSTEMDDAIRLAADRGALLVAAAGNVANACPAEGTRVLYPARDGRVVAVAALVPPGVERRSDSACGEEVELAAPGEQVLTTQDGGGYGDFRGTSAATPVVSAAAALVLSAHPTLRAAEVRCILQSTATDLYEAGRDRSTGFGRVDAAAAVALAASGSGCA